MLKLLRLQLLAAIFRVERASMKCQSCEDVAPVCSAHVSWKEQCDPVWLRRCSGWFSVKNKLYCGNCYPQEPIPRETADERLCRKHFKELYPLEQKFVDKGTDVQGSSLPKADQAENASNAGKSNADNAGSESNACNEMKSNATNADNAGNEMKGGYASSSAGNASRSAGNASSASGYDYSAPSAGNASLDSPPGLNEWIVAGHVTDGTFRP